MGGRKLCSTHVILESLPLFCQKLIVSLFVSLCIQVLHRLPRLHSSINPLILIHAASQQVRDLGMRLNKQRWHRGLHTQTDTWPLWHDSRRFLVPIPLFERDRSVSRLMYLRRSCRNLSALRGEWLRRTGAEWWHWASRMTGGREDGRHEKGRRTGGRRDNGRRRLRLSFGLSTGLQKRSVIL